MSFQQEPVSGRAPAGVDRWRAVTEGITGKIAGVVAALLAVFALSIVALVNQIEVLGRGDARAAALDAGHHAASEALVAYQTQVATWHEVVAHDGDAGTRSQHVRALRESSDAVAESIQEAVAALPAGPHQDAARRFAAEQRTLRAAYDKALALLQSSGDRERAEAEAKAVDVVAPFERFETVVEGIDAELDTLNAAHVARVERRVRIVIVVSVLLLAALVAMTAVVVRRIVRPIRQVTAEAERIADVDLPAAVARIRSMTLDEQPPAVEPIDVGTRDETASLARAFHSLHTKAVELAVEQRRAESESAEMLVNLGRRNQNLLNRTLAYITELERSEQDPDVLDRLFRLDHATTRIRRNAESMLVLAGAHQTRTWAVPAPVSDIIRAALSEVEDYGRVDIYHVQEAAVGGGAIADVVHLLAELIENATNFSPPSTKVTVVGQVIADGYRIRIIDEGIGMTRGELDAANGSIRHATEGTGASKLLGLYVVGRLAARRGVEVMLEASGGRGVTATVVLPADVLADLPAEPRPDEPRPDEPRPDAPRPAESRPVEPRAVEPRPDAAVTDGRHEVSVGHDSPRRDHARERQPGVPSPATAGFTRRVPGAQLPDLGPAADEGPQLASVDPLDVRGRLSSFQAGVRAGREVDVVDSDDASVPAERTDATPGPGSGPRSATVQVVGNAVPVRVPGAQLPDLGLIESGPDSYLSPATIANRWALRSFQLDVDAARRSAPEPVDGVQPAEGDVGRPADRTPEEA